MQVIRKTAIALFILSLLCLNLFGGALSQSITPGVSAGNTFTYSVKGLWSSNDSNATISESILQLNKTDYIRVTITNVSESDVNMHILWRFINGTESEIDDEINVATGIYTRWFWAVFPANLNAGDRIHPHGPDRTTVNASYTREFLDETREINRYRVTGEFASTDNTNRTYSDIMTVHFDRQIGMLVELYDYKTYTNPAYFETIIWEIIDTNTFGSSEPPPNQEIPLVIIIVPVAIIIALIAFIAYRKRFAKPRKKR